MSNDKIMNLLAIDTSTDYLSLAVMRDGKITAQLARLIKNGHVLGIDSSESMINLASEQFPSTAISNLSFQLMGAEEIHLSEKFDVAFSNAALHWVEDHAAELGVDTNKIVVGGSSAGGHLALWTAIAKAPFGSKPEESPTTKPAALVLISAPSEVWVTLTVSLRPTAVKRVS